MSAHSGAEEIANVYDKQCDRHIHVFGNDLRQWCIAGICPELLLKIQGMYPTTIIYINIYIKY